MSKLLQTVNSKNYIAYSISCVYYRLRMSDKT